METKILQPNQVELAAKLIKQGELVGMPTETVYGLAADALNARAVEKIFIAKGRPMDNPLIVHVASLKDVEPLVAEFSKTAQKLAQAFWPGPLTIVMPRSSVIPNGVSAGLSTVAVRYPAHPVAESLILAAKTPLAAPSANLSGSPSPTQAMHVYNDLNGKIPAIIDGGRSEVGLESTVITVATKTPTLLRPGGVTLEELRDVIGEVAVDKGVLNQLEQNAVVQSPGMKYKHYAPKTKIVLLKCSRAEYIEFLSRAHTEKAGALCYEEDAVSIHIPKVIIGKAEDYQNQAFCLFDKLRAIDAMQVGTVYANCPEPEGMGLAVYNRLIRAAGFEVTELA